jgi:hypothetical protein
MHVFMHGSHGKHEHITQEKDEPASFQETTNKNGAFRDGYIEGLKAGREEKVPKEKNDER